MITASLGLDWSNFQSGIQGAISSIQMLGGGASIFGALTMAVKGFYEAIQYGDDLVDLNAQTGVAIDKLMELQMAFDLNGMKADQLQPVIAKMQRLIAEAGSGSAEAAAKFSMMGIEIADIQGLNADEQLMKIGEAIKKIQNPAQRSAMAMEIFGKSGAKLLSVFAAGGLEEVRKVLGNQSALLLQNAGVFGKASDILGLTGNKIRGFFVGMASEIVPPLMGLLEKSSTLDFSGAGSELGKFGIGLIVAGKEIFTYLAMAADMIVDAFSKAADFIFAPALYLGELLGGDRRPSGYQEGATYTKDTYLSRGLAEMEKAAEEARKNNPTPGAAPTGMDILSKTAQSVPNIISTTAAKTGALGGASWGMDEALNVQREQLSVQQRMANSLDNFLKTIGPTQNPYIGNVTPQLGAI
jgi:hypothetical protein